MEAKGTSLLRRPSALTEAEPGCQLGSPNSGRAKCGSNFSKNAGTGMSVSCCQQQTHAAQQTASSFDHLVGERQHVVGKS
jgi:hypothetical protein